MPARLTIIECNEIAELKGGECLSEEYKSCKIKLKWKCSNNHIFEACIDSIKYKNTWCKICSGYIQNIEECQEYARSKGGKCLTKIYKDSKTIMEWQCKDGFKWKTSYNSMKNQSHWCPHCVGQARLTLKECQDLAITKGGRCLSDKYINMKTKMNWECAKGHTWDTTMDCIKSKDSWCPYCTIFKSEEKCREFIEEIMSDKFPKCRPNFLKHKTKNLELDGFCKRQRTGFEYHGCQHYVYIPHFHRNGIQDFETQKQRDVLKLKLCKKNKVDLIIIPHTYCYTNPGELYNFIYEEIFKLI
jgi:hypothetical protein